jgi:hypothetical protein
MPLWAWALGAVFAWRFAAHFKGTFEGRAYDWLFGVTHLASVLLIAIGTVRFVRLGGSLLACLRRLAAEPMVDAYDRIADKVSGSFGLQLRARVPEAADLVVAVLSARKLASFQASAGDVDLETAASVVETRFREMKEPAPHGASSEREKHAHEALFAMAVILRDRLGEEWVRTARDSTTEFADKYLGPDKLMKGGDRAAIPTVTLLMDAIEPARYLWIRAAEDFVAIRNSTLVYQVLNELRDTLSTALALAFLLVLSVNVYPFRPAHFLAIVDWSIVLAVVVAAFYRILALERDEVLSRLAGKTPNQIEWNGNFVQQLVTYVALPLAAAVVGLFPELGDWLVRVFAPITRVVGAGG